MNLFNFAAIGVTFIALIQRTIIRLSVPSFLYVVAYVQTKGEGFFLSWK